MWTTFGLFAVFHANFWVVDCTVASVVTCMIIIWILTCWIWAKFLSRYVLDWLSSNYYFWHLQPVNAAHTCMIMRAISHMWLVYIYMLNMCSSSSLLPHYFTGHTCKLNHCSNMICVIQVVRIIFSSVFTMHLFLGIGRLSFIFFTISSSIRQILRCLLLPHLISPRGRSHTSNKFSSYSLFEMFPYI